METVNVEVVYVAGPSRSGSTLLGRLLGAIPEHVDVGELRHLFERGLGQDQLCSCGEAFSRCASWSRVVEGAFGRLSSDEVRAMRLVGGVTRRRHAWRLLRTRESLPVDFGARVDAYVRRMARLLAAIRDVSGAGTVVDSSKFAAPLLLLGRVPGLRLSVVQIVRDARAVAWSWRRRVRRPEFADREAEMDRLPAVRSAMEWNLALARLRRARRRLDVPWTVIRHEDLVADPAASLRRVLAELGRPEPDLSFLRGHEADLPAGHSVSGNPMRFSAGRTLIRPDEEWRSALPTTDFSLVTALCRRGLLRHGYPVRRRGG